ncbi:mate-domain-containing protein [Biscogniauxia sp. FL1348]|nr:mate-domain-containing protein [Biscogniauxia sp. FL1348]
MEIDPVTVLSPWTTRAADSPRRDPPSERTPLLADAKPADGLARDTWWSELRLLAGYSVPLVATYLLQYSYSVITTFVAGHLSADDLAAAAVGMTTMNIVGLATFEGMATALDTLCAQAYGAGHRVGVGLHVQRMLLCMALAALPIGAFWLCSPWVLALFLRQPRLAVLAGRFLRVSLVGLPGYASFEAGKRFLQAQGDFRSAMVILVICTPVNAALSNWGPMVRLSFAGSAVNLGEWAAFEMVAFSTSYLSTTHLAAQTLLTTISVVSWHNPLLDQRRRQHAHRPPGRRRAALHRRRAAAIYACVFTFIGCFDGFVIFVLRGQLTRFFSDRSLHSIICYTNGMIRGLGRQFRCCLGRLWGELSRRCPYCHLVELGPWGLGIDGIWIGLGGGMVLIALIECLYMRLLRWQDCVESAKLREDS